MTLPLTGAGRSGAAGAASPTTLLMLPWLPGTETFLKDDHASPALDGDIVGTWVPLTGADFTDTLAIAAGASGGPDLFVGNGISGETFPLGAALVTGTPVVIGASVDFDLWVLFGPLDDTGNSFPILGSTATTQCVRNSDDGRVYLEGDGLTVAAAAGLAANALIRIGRLGSSWNYARTGVPQEAMSVDIGTGLESIVLNAVKARGNGTTLDTFMGGPFYIKAIRIDTYATGYTGRAVWRAAVEAAAFSEGGFDSTPL